MDVIEPSCFFLFLFFFFSSSFLLLFFFFSSSSAVALAQELEMMFVATQNQVI